MTQTNSQRITICTSCRHTSRTCQLGYELIAKLRAAISAAGDSIPENFEISGTAALPGCGIACTVGYHANHGASHFFGDIEPNEDIDALVRFAKENATKLDAFDNSCSLEDLPKPNQFARMPASVIAIETSAERVS